MKITKNFFILGIIFIFVGMIPIARILFSSLRVSLDANVSQGQIDGSSLFDLIQEFRTKSGKKPYRQSRFLCYVAEIRLEEVKTDFSHKDFSEWRFCPGCGLAENLARGFNSEETVLTAWLNSSSHLANLNTNYSHSCLKTDGETIVQIFGYF